MGKQVTFHISNINDFDETDNSSHHANKSS